MIEVPPDVPLSDQPKKVPPNPMMIRDLLKKENKEFGSLRDILPFGVFPFGTHKTDQNEQNITDDQMKSWAEVDDDDEHYPGNPEKKNINDDETLEAKEIDSKTEKLTLMKLNLENEILTEKTPNYGLLGARPKTGQHYRPIYAEKDKLLKPKCKKSVLGGHDEKLRDRLEKSEKFGSFSKFSTENNQNLGKNGPKRQNMIGNGKGETD